MDLRFCDLSLTAPEKKISPSQFRHIVASHAGEAGIDPVLFNYRDENHTMNIKPRFQFDRDNTGRLHIFGFGDAAVAHLRKESCKVVEVIEKHFGTTVSENFNVRDYKIGIGLAEYYVPLLVFQEALADHARFAEACKKGVVTPGLTSFVERKIERSLREFCRISGLDQELENDVMIGDVRLSSKFVPIQVRPGVFFLGNKDVRFSSNLDIEGPVFVGHLTSRGFGKMMPARRGRA
jgi:hypothetical protein